MIDRLKRLLARRARRPGLIRFLVRASARRHRGRGVHGVAAVIVDERGRVLLLEHVFWPVKRWGLPGGWARGGESPEDAVRREVREELRLEVAVVRQLAREENGSAWLCTIEPPAAAPRLSFEILDARWFAPGELPDDLLPFHREALERAMGSGRGIMV